MPEYNPMEVEHFEKSIFESMAEIYAETTGCMTALSGQTELAVEFGKISKRSHVLELGCGPGQLAYALSKEAGDVKGVDFAENMIRAAQVAFPELNFQVANGEELPFDDSIFDVVVCNYTALHLARPKIVFREVLRTLRPNGRVVIINPIRDKAFLFGAFRDALNKELPGWQLPRGPLAGAGPEGYESLLSDCGYSKIKCEIKVKPLVVADIDILLDGLMVNLRNQPGEIQDRVRAGTRDRAAEYQRSDGNYYFRDEVLVVVGYG
jgi:ubiquinone/menaquinone biosynthesis C-methylase UbiE